MIERTLSVRMNCSMKHILILLVGMSSSGVARAEALPSRESLFPAKGEMLQREHEKNVLEGLLQVCFPASSRVGNYPLGYARFARSKADALSISLVKSTFQDKFIDSCILSKAAEFLQKSPEDQSWSHLHLVSACEKERDDRTFKADDLRCGLRVFMNNFSESEEFKEIVESQWKAKKPGLNEALQSTIKLLRFLQAVTSSPAKR